MIKQWVGNLTPKQIIIFVALMAVAIYVVWYVIEALEGLDTNYEPGRTNWYSPQQGQGEYFDPTKKTPEAVPAK